MKELDELRNGTTAMTDAVLLFSIHLGKGPFMAFWHEDRVVAKATLTSLLVDDMSFYLSFEIVVGIIRHKGNDCAEVRLTVLLVLQFPEQLVHIGLRVVPHFGSIASRIAAKWDTSS